jgi:cytochrome c
MFKALLAALPLCLASAPALAADTAHGQVLFQQDCALCHTAGPADGDGGMGPDLAGVIGRKVAGDPSYPYSDALSRVGGAWTQDSLADFLENPDKVAPGTPMSLRLKDPAERADIAAYLATVPARQP